MKNKYYVYELINPFTNVPFYIGKGSANRAWSHIDNVKKIKTSDNKYKDKIIKGILNKNNEPIVNIIMNNMFENDAYLLEEIMIRLYGRIKLDKNGILTNRCINNKPPRS